MNRKSAVISLLFVALVGATVRSPGWAAADTRPPGREPVGSDYVPDGSSLCGSTRRCRRPRRGGRHRGRTGRPGFDRVAPGLQRVVLDEGVDVEDAAAELRLVVTSSTPAELPHPRPASRTTALPSTGCTTRASRSGASPARPTDIDAPEAWNVTTGNSNVVVAIGVTTTPTSPRTCG